MNLPPRRVAVHEAGHAVITELLYLNLNYVTIEPDHESAGRSQRGIPTYTATDRWRELLVNCAGHIAEGLTPEDLEVGDAYDAMSAVWPGDEVSDAAKLWASLEDHSNDDAQRWAWFEMAFAQAERILRNRAVWRSVETLAGRLVEARTLDRGEAADAISAALGRSKWKRERFQMGKRHASPPPAWIESREEYRHAAALLAAYVAGGPRNGRQTRQSREGGGTK